MKILIVEDQEEKANDLKDYILQLSPNAHCIDARSLRSGLRQIMMVTDLDLIVLDMSMPNFEPTQDNPSGGSPESFAGRELLAQMDLRNIKTPVVIVTQYPTFEKGQVNLKDLDHDFRKNYPQFYIGSIYYSSANDAWQADFKLAFERALK
jgi:CheY-like chemotaxis protein